MGIHETLSREKAVPAVLAVVDVQAGLRKAAKGVFADDEMSDVSKKGVLFSIDSMLDPMLLGVMASTTNYGVCRESWKEAATVLFGMDGEGEVIRKKLSGAKLRPEVIEQVVSGLKDWGQVVIELIDECYDKHGL